MIRQKSEIPEYGDVVIGQNTRDVVGTYLGRTADKIIVAVDHDESCIRYLTADRLEVVSKHDYLEQSSRGRLGRITERILEAVCVSAGTKALYVLAASFLIFGLGEEVIMAPPKECLGDYWVAESKFFK